MADIKGMVVQLLILIWTTKNTHSIKTLKKLFMKSMLRLIVLKNNLKKGINFGSCRNSLSMRGMAIKVHALLDLENTIITENMIHLELFTDLFYYHLFI